MPTPGKHDADRMLSLVLGKRIEKDVDRRPLAIRRAGAAEPQTSLANGQDRARRQDIDMLRLDPLAILGVDAACRGANPDDRKSWRHRPTVVYYICMTANTQVTTNAS